MATSEGIGNGGHSTCLCFTKRFPPSPSSALVACEIQNCDLSPYRRIFPDVLPSGRERVQAFDSDDERRKVWTVVLVQRRELFGVED